MSRICNYSSLLSVYLNTTMISNRNPTRKEPDPRVGDRGSSLSRSTPNLQLYTEQLSLRKT